MTRLLTRLLTMTVAAGLAAAPPPAAPPRVTVRFSPRGGCTDLVVWHVDAARESVLVASYQWSSRPVHDAVLRAKARGLAVRVVLDRAAEHAPLAAALDAGLGAGAVRVDDRHAIYHNKVIVRDPGTPGAAHENGTFNFSAAAETSNAENAQVLEGFPAATAAYAADFEAHWSHARPRRPAP